MVTTKLYHDTRAVASDNVEAPIKLQINKCSKTALLPTGIKVPATQWDKHALKIVKHPNRNTLNAYITKIKLKVDEMLMDMTLRGELVDLSATEIKNIIAAKFMGERAPAITLGDYFNRYADSKSESTRDIYRGNFKVVVKYDCTAPTRSLRSCTKEWAHNLSEYLEKNYSANTRRQILSNLNAMFNHALDERLVALNPIKGLKLSYVLTRKRNLHKEQILKLWNAIPGCEGEEVALDLFKFSFLTIAANTVDIAHLTPESIFNGRIEYVRAKTKKQYSVAIVPELEPLIEKYKTKKSLFSYFEKYKDYRSQSCNLNHSLQALGDRCGLPKISFYWARHTWASIAAEIDIPIDIISAALGHSHGAKVTMIYINQDQKKVDDAHRKVLDYLFKEEGL